MRSRPSNLPSDSGTTAYQHSVRRANLGAVLSDVATCGQTSRARIAAATGLNKTTVSSLVTELLEMGLLEDADGEGRTGLVGRPSQPVRLNRGRVVSLGLEINIDFLSVRAVDLTGAVRHARQVTVDNR